MKQSAGILFLCFSAIVSLSQSFDLEGLKLRYRQTQNDTLRIIILDSLSIGYSELDPDSSYHYAEQGILLSKSLRFPINEAAAENMSAYALLNLGNYPASLQKFLRALDLVNNEDCEKIVIPEKYRRTFGILSKDISPRSYRLQVLAFIYFNWGILYENANNLEKALGNYFLALDIGELIKNRQITSGTSMNIGRIYLRMNKRDSALIYLQNSYAVYQEIGLEDYLGSSLLNLGRVYLADGKEEIAVSFFHKAKEISQNNNYLRGAIAANLQLADLSIRNKTLDSAFLFNQNALQLAVQMNVPDLLLRTYNSISNYYQAIKNSDSAVKYLNLVIRIKDSLFNTKQSRQFQNIDFEAMQRKKELETAKKAYRDRLLKYVLTTGLAVFLIIVIILWRNNRNKHKANQLLTRQKRETDKQKAKAEQTLDELKQTQSQLIQKEKMASLGELTAGIAHEIENPLNFVNNFSELNTELIEEAKSEINNGNLDVLKTILNDISSNEEKIITHGKRADAIVKSMLQHSRTSSGNKEPTDINALCDEYLRLAYHGMKAKVDTLSSGQAGFNAVPKDIGIKTNYDNTIGQIDIVPQDIGRVILNMINNAFYAVNEKAKQNIPGYEPTVTVRTKKLDGKIEICVKDNGNGIPDSIKEKIFQPFFTTKPTGQGTGLGLSLSYDIVKAHGGEIEVDTRENEGAVFYIRLPY